MHSFAEEFYGHQLSLILLAYLRPQYSLTSLELLMQWIQHDVDTAQRCLHEQPYLQYRSDTHFSHSSPLRSHV